MDKKALRATYKAKRQGFSQAQIETLSLEIANNALKLPVWQQRCFHIFLPIVHHKEINTEFLLHILAGKDKRIIVSKADFESAHMTHFLLDEHTKLIPNSFGIPEPVDGLEVAANQIDVVFVPLLAFDLSGQRVGYGKGFYDRFLSQCKADVVKVGLSFFEAEMLISDTDLQDVPLDFCVTPQKVYAF